MRTHFFPTMLVICILLAALFAVSCGESKSSNSSSSPNINELDDDDNDDDNDNDDNDDDNDDNDNDNDNDDNDNDDDTFPSLVCSLPDPMSLGAGVLIGGGPATTQIDVYLYDDGACTPIGPTLGGKVLYGGTVYPTDDTGHVTLTVSKAAATVTAWAANSWAWTYEADAAVMYFRLRPDEYNRTYADSTTGGFTQGGNAVTLTNPDLAGLFTNPLYAGVVAPGLSRRDILSFDAPAGLLALGTWDLTVDTTNSNLVYYVDDNVYLPTLDLNAGAAFTVSGGNNGYAVPVQQGASVAPIEGVIASLDVVKAVPSLQDLLTLVGCVTGGGNVVTCLVPYIVPAVNDALGVAYVGANPTWAGTGAPTIETVTPAATLPLTVSNPSANYDYLAIIGADIPNRALIPFGLGIAESGAAALDYVTVPDAAYITGLIATDLLTSDLTAAHFSAAIKYADDLSGWTSGVTFDAAADFLPWFDDANTAYNGATGEITWALSAKKKALAPDLYMIAYIPACKGCKVIFAQVPGTETSYQVPTEAMNITPSASDIVLLFGFSLPSGVDINAYNPVGILGYNLAAVNFWTNYDILSLLP